MLNIQGPVGGNFANNQGRLRAKAMQSTIKNNTIDLGNGASILPKTAMPPKPSNPVNLGKNKGGVPYYSGKPTLQQKGAEFRQDQGPANTNNGTLANPMNKTKYS